MSERLSRRAVVQHAAELADDLGLDNLTITKVGRSLGITPPGVYRHVTDLDDLRAAIGEQAARQVAASITSACAGLSGRDALAALAHTLRAWAVQFPGQYAALQIAPDGDDEPGQSAAHAVLEAISSAMRAYSLEGDDLTDAIRFIRSTLHGFIALQLDEGFKQERDLDASFVRIIIALDSAVDGWRTGGRTGGLGQRLRGRR